MSQVVAYASGDLGDVIALLPIIRHLGGGHLIIGPHIGLGEPREPMTEQRANLIIPLIAAQPYIESVKFGQKNMSVITHDFSLFRAHAQAKKGESLTAWQARAMGIKGEIDMAPWLTVDQPASASQGRAVVSRSERYHNPCFDWSAIRQCFPNPMFVGTAREHRKLIEIVGQIDHAPTDNLMDVARLIAGSELFIGNQSSPCWIAMGLGHRMIQETCTWVDNSIVPRPNAWFVRSEMEFFEACGLESPEHTKLRDCNLLIGTGKTPLGYEEFKTIDRWQDMINMRGRVRIHLHGAWWSKIRPERLQIVLASLEQNESKPIVTVGA